MLKDLLCIVALAAIAASATAQSVGDGERALRDAVIRKQLFLRGFSADPVVVWRWDGSTLAQQEPRVHTLGAFLGKSVKVRGDRVEIQGERHTVLRSSDTTFTLSGVTDKVRIEIDLNGADMAGLLPKLADLIFYADQESAVAGLPSYYSASLPAPIDQKCCSKKLTVDLKRCDCASPSVAVCGKERPGVGMAGMKPPTVLSSVEPEFSEEARRHKISGSVQVGLSVDASGRGHDFWLMKPVGVGLDAKAVEAVSLYTFKPATCHGRDVATAIYIDVSFTIF
jgi:TonB family protein